ncbi:MAG: YgiT-type zinc finger protein [Candidatus Diapherotrites archaeon]
MSMKCIHCNTPTKKVSAKRKYFNRCLIENVQILKCTKCGEKYLDENEYEKIKII